MHVLGPGSPCLAWPGVVAAAGPSRAGASGLPRGRGAGRRWVARVSQGRAGSPACSGLCSQGPVKGAWVNMDTWPSAGASTGSRAVSSGVLVPTYYTLRSPVSSGSSCLHMPRLKKTKFFQV